MKTSLNIPILITFIVVTLAAPLQKAAADAWWGEGGRKVEWVLDNGGTIIKYKISGKESSSNYKARMYLGEKLIETEYGGSGKFDDAIRNTYSILVFKGGKKKMATTVTAHPGETISLKFDLKKKKVSFSSDLAKITQQPKPKPKPISIVKPVQAQVESEPEPVPEELTQKEVDAVNRCEEIRDANKFTEKFYSGNITVTDLNINTLKSAELIPTQ